MRVSDPLFSGHLLCVGTLCSAPKASVRVGYYSIVYEISSLAFHCCLTLFVNLLQDVPSGGSSIENMPLVNNKRKI